MGQLILPTSGHVYVDANVVIYSVEKIEPYWAMLRPLWQAAQREQFMIISSELLLLETLVKPLRDGDNILEKTFRQLLLGSKEVQLIPVTQSILEKAASLRAFSGLKAPDAIHAATALEVGASSFITNDPAFKRISGIPVSVLQDIIAILP